VPRPSTKTPSARARRAAVATSCALALAFAANGISRASNANYVHAFVVGKGAGLASSEWLDASNTSRARVRFPRAPAIAFRVRLPGGIGQAPASDALGNLIVLHGEPRVSKLDAQGHTIWTKRLESEASSAPVLTSDGSILLLSHDAEALLFSSSGVLLHKSAVPLDERRHRSLAIPTINGGAWLASGTDIVELDATAQITRQGHAPGNVTALLQWGSNSFAICENGALLRAGETGNFEVVGNLGGAVPEGGAVQNGKLFAIVDAHKLVAFDLVRNVASTLASDPAVALSGPPVLFENQSTAVVADGGFLSLHATAGNETLRVSIAEASRAFDPATRGLRPALAIGDPEGAVAAVRSGSDALLLEPDGKAQRLDGSSCLDPFRPTPTLHGLVFACRSGQLFWVSDKAP